MNGVGPRHARRGDGSPLACWSSFVVAQCRSGPCDRWRMAQTFHTCMLQRARSEAAVFWFGQVTPSENHGCADSIHG